MIHNGSPSSGGPTRTEEVPDETWREMMDTAVRASFYCAQAAFHNCANARAR
jgi:NAD(P)-dependent dehydrogenase (short-subunit alcohol dehydrogenase family)